MTGAVLEYAGWGLFGAGAAEALVFRRAMIRVKSWPWNGADEPSASAYLIGFLISVVVGAGLAAAAATSHQISGPVGAVAIGIAAPRLIEELGRSAQLTSHDPANPSTLASNAEKTDAS